jgi:hypothetical protein
MIGFEDWMKSEYITVDEKGWHISDDAPDDLKEKFREFIVKAEQGIEIELK